LKETLIQTIARATAIKLTPQETHAVGVLFVMRFGRGCQEARTFARHVNAAREKLGLPIITQAVAGNPTTEEKLELFGSAMEKLGDEALTAIIQIVYGCFTA